MSLDTTEFASTDLPDPAVSWEGDALVLTLPPDLRHDAECIAEAVRGAVLAKVAEIRERNAWTMPDGPERRAILGHQDEPTMPGYCTCGALAARCATR